jgi:hypothetical protein
MSTVQPTDKTLVNRAGVDHSAPADMSTVQDTDLLLINRAGVDYKCTFLDWKNSQTKAPDVGAVTLADVAGGSRFTSTAFPVSATMTDDGLPVSTKKLKAYVEGTLKSAAQSSAITKATEVIAPGGFAVKQYSGNGGTQTISGLTFSPDFVWIKARNAADHHALFDTSRGATYRLFTNSTSNEVQNTDMLTSFNSDGFSLGNNTAVNGSGRNHVAYAWDAGSSAVTNTDGTIASQVRANPSAGFSVVTYAGNNTARASIGHGLGTPPSVILLKNRSKNNVGWPMYHASIGTGKYMQFNVTDAVYSSFNGYTSVTSSTFTVEDDSWTTPKDTSDYVAYCFAPVAGFSSFGTFNGGDAVTCGFSPALVMVKRTDGTSDWEMVDKLGGTAAAVWPNKTDQAGAATVITGLTSTGFTTTGGGTYIYAAWNDELKGVDLEFTDNTSLANFVAGEAVTEVGNADDGTGTVSAVNAAAVPPTMKLAAVGGTWDVGSAVKGPLKTTGPNAKLYCKLDAAGAVSDLQSADPGFTAWTPAGTGPYTGTVTFPATLPTGNAPDADLPAGTTITVEVQATNTSGSDSAKSNTVIPA